MQRRLKCGAWVSLVTLPWLAIGCGSAGSTATDDEASEQTSAGSEVPAAEPVEQMRRIAANQSDGVVNLETGVVFVERATDPGEGTPGAVDGNLYVAARFCGPALVGLVAELAEDVSMHLEDEYYEPVCEGSACSLESMGEYSPGSHYVFGGDGRLVSVVRIEGGAIGEEWLDAAAAWTGARRAELERGGCTVTEAPEGEWHFPYRAP